MAENQADDDDDEGFGDFKFVSSYNNSNQINNDDDDWGDFVDNISPKQDLNQNPIQFHYFNDFTNPPNPSNPSQTSKNSNFFGGFSDQWTEPLATQPSKVDTEKNSPTAEKSWEKPRGALPLSLFGDEEEESDTNDSTPFDNNAQNLFSSKQTSPVINGLRFGSGIGIKDIIVNLYSQSEQIKTENGLKSNSNLNLVDENGDFDDEDGWEFKDAFVEKRPEDSFSELKRDENVLGLSGIQVEPTTTTNGDIKVGIKPTENSEVVNGQLDDNWLLTSDAFSNKPTEIENGLVFESGGATTASNCTSDFFNQIGAENGLNSNLVDGSFDSDENFSDFQVSFSPTAAANYSSVQKEELKVADHSSVQVKELRINEEFHVNGNELWNNQGPLPGSNFSNGKLDSDDSLFVEDMFPYRPSMSMNNQATLPGSNFSNGKLDSDGSLFGEDMITHKPLTSKNNQGALPVSKFINGKLDSDDSLFGEDIFLYKPSTSMSNGLNDKVVSSNFAFNDLIFNLYRQTEQIPTVLSSQEATKSGFSSGQTVMNSDVVEGEDDFDENLWEFRGAPLETFSETGPGDTFQKFPTEAKSTVLSSQEATENGFNSAQTVLNSNLVEREDNFDESSWEFRGPPSDTFLETGPEDTFHKFLTEEKSTVLSSQAATENGFKSVQMVSSSNLAKGVNDFGENSWDFKGAFSEAITETGPGDMLQSTGSKSTILSPQEATENGVKSVQTVLIPALMHDDNDFDENSWEFKGGLSEAFTRTGSGNILQKCPTVSKLKSYISFYSKLKEGSYCVALHHIDCLKKAKTAAALSSEDAKAVAIHEEIQKAYKKLHDEELNFEKVNTGEHPPTYYSVNELLELVKEPELQALESEFNLSKRISLAEKNLSSAIEIFEHSISILKILTLGSMEDQLTYITTWSKVLSACAQELKHGAFIWKQSLQKKIHRQILSKTRGQQYVVALGEIYRVVEVLRTSTTVYRPWILSTLSNPKEIFGLLEECKAFWLDSKLEEALLCFSDQVEGGYEGKALVNSIKSVQDLDLVALQKHVLQEPICRLSLLSLKTIPDMKEVEWEGKNYFLTLANLWANLISLDPPKLPQIYVIG